MNILNNALYWSHEYVKKSVSHGDTVVDATMGNGNDTLFLSNLVGANGHVYAFDIQPRALENTRQRLLSANALPNTTLILDGHQNMSQHVTGPVSAVMFNFGYLPGGDHSIGTRAETDLAAIDQALALLKTGGLATLCIYYGGDTGFAEKEAILAHVQSLDFRRYSVLRHEYVNQLNCAPILVCIEKLATADALKP